MSAADDPTAFVLANTRLRPVPLVPEIQLHVADEAVPIWEKTEEELGEIGLPPPFWAFAWAGGQALARYLLDNPDLVRGRRVLDFASGSGLVAIAAVKAGAASVLATDLDPFCEAAMTTNGRANGVAFDILLDDLTRSVALPAGREFDLICAGDVYYEAETAKRVTDWLGNRHRSGTPILIGDPGRSYLPKEHLKACAEYAVPVTRALEDSEIKQTIVWAFQPTFDGIGS